MEKQSVDYIIVGQGLAGSCMAFQLIAAGKKVAVIDFPEENRSTRIAAGLFICWPRSRSAISFPTRCRRRRRVPRWPPSSVGHSMRPGPSTRTAGSLSASPGISQASASATSQREVCTCARWRSCRSAWRPTTRSGLGRICARPPCARGTGRNLRSIMRSRAK